jgi:hypothetical protein
MYLVASIVLATLSTVLAILPRHNLGCRGHHAIRSTGNTSDSLSNGCNGRRHQTLRSIHLIANQVVGNIQNTLYGLAETGVENTRTPLLTIALPGVLTTVLTRVLATVLTRVLPGVLTIVLATVLTRGNVVLATVLARILATGYIILTIISTGHSVIY